MPKITLIILTILLIPTTLNASYYVSDYDPDYVPYNLQEAIDNSNHLACKSKVESFDKTYNEYLDLYGTPISVGETLDVNFGALKEVYEEEFRQCLATARKEKLEESIGNCDFSIINSLSYDNERTYRGDIKECKNERAVNDCDFEYINNMSGSEKFKYRNEIDTCKAKLEPEEAEPEPTPITQTTSEIKTSKVTEVIPETIPEPVYTPTLSSIPKPYTPANPEPKETEEVILKSTTTEEVTEIKSGTIEMTQEEIDALVEKRVSEAIKENSQPEEVGFFRKIWIFFTSWF